MLPSTANAKDGTIDVVWYSGAAVPRVDRATGEPYMLQLDMQGCRFDRLNNGAPVFDTHFTGDDFKSLMAGKVGTRAQLGVVRRAWPNGDKGMATLQFDLGDPDGAEMFRKARPASSRTSASEPSCTNAKRRSCRRRGCRRASRPT